MKKVCWFIIVAAFVICGMNPNAFAEKKVWNLKGSTYLPPAGARWENAVYFAKELKERTNGRVILEVVPSGGLAPALEEWDYLSKGLIDFSQPGDGWVAAQYNEFGLLGAALVESKDVPALMKAGVLDIWDRIAAKDNIKLIGAWASTGFNSTALKSKNIHSPSDYEGQAIFASGVMHDKIHELLGAKMIPVAPGEFFTALQTGVMQGVTTSVSAQQSFKIYETCRYITYYPGAKNLGVFAYIPAFNMKVWKSFPPDIQETIMKLGEEVTEQSIARWRKSDQGTMAFLKGMPDRVTLYGLTDAEADVILNLVRKPVQEFFVQRGKGGKWQLEKDLLAIVEKFQKK